MELYMPFLSLGTYKHHTISVDPPLKDSRLRGFKVNFIFVKQGYAIYAQLSSLLWLQIMVSSLVHLDACVLLMMFFLFRRTN